MRPTQPTRPQARSAGSLLRERKRRQAEIVAALESGSGEPVPREYLARVSPLANAHVIPSGTYHFDRAKRPDRVGLE